MQFVENFLNRLRSYKKLVYYNRCRLYYKDETFRKIVLGEYPNANLWHIQRKGTKNEEQVVYSIREFGGSVGFFGEFIFLLIELYFASERGLIPYVEWGKNFLYYEPAGVGEEKNAFLYFFEQTSNIRDIDNTAFLLEMNVTHIKDVQKEINGYSYHLSKEYIDKLSLMVKKYIKYNDKTRMYLEEEYERLIGNRKALAVHFRGSDYRRQYDDHPKFIGIEDELAVVEEIMKKEYYDVIFLATDEEMAVETFKKKFGDKILVYEDVMRVSAGDESIAFSKSDRVNHHYLLGLEVIRDQYTLTRSCGLVGGVTNITTAAQIMRRAWYEKDYEDLIILDYGLCKNERVFSDAKH